MTTRIYYSESGTGNVAQASADNAHLLRHVTHAMCAAEAVASVISRSH